MREVFISGPRGGVLRVRVARTRRERARGLLGGGAGTAVREAAMLFPRARWVHTVGMRRAIRVAHLDADLRVLAARDVPPGRWVVPPRGTRHVLEAPAAADLRAGDALAILRTLPPRRGRVGSHDVPGPPSSSGLGSRPFKAVTRVRIPLGARNRIRAGVEESGVLTALSRRRSRDRSPSPALEASPGSPGGAAWPGSSVGRARA